MVNYNNGGRNIVHMPSEHVNYPGISAIPDGENAAPEATSSVRLEGVATTDIGEQAEIKACLLRKLRRSGGVGLRLLPCVAGPPLAAQAVSEISLSARRGERSESRQQQESRESWLPASVLL